MLDYIINPTNHMVHRKDYTCNNRPRNPKPLGRFNSIQVAASAASIDGYSKAKPCTDCGKRRG